MHVAAAIADPVPSRLVDQLAAGERTAPDLATEIARGRATSTDQTIRSTPGGAA